MMRISLYQASVIAAVMTLQQSVSAIHIDRQENQESQASTTDMMAQTDTAVNAMAESESDSENIGTLGASMAFSAYWMSKAMNKHPAAA